MRAWHLGASQRLELHWSICGEAGMSLVLECLRGSRHESLVLKCLWGSRHGSFALEVWWEADMEAWQFAVLQGVQSCIGVSVGKQA